jgi:prefoldin subunit 5
MRDGKFEKELRELTYEAEAIPKQLKEIKRRGRHVQSCENKVRKASVRFERARRICLNLPKPWQYYTAHGVGRNLYARPEVQEINDANNRLYNEKDYLRHTVERYEKRYTDRAELKSRFRELPDMIESAKQLAEIEAKKKALRLTRAKPETGWKSKWQEVAPGVVIQANKLKAYLKTFKEVYPIGEETATVENGFFTFWPYSYTNRVFLKLKCYTWQQAEYCRQ